MFDPKSGSTFETLIPNVQMMRADWETPRCPACLVETVEGQLLALVGASTLCAPCATEDGLLCRQA